MIAPRDALQAPAATTKLAISKCRQASKMTGFGIFSPNI